MTTKGQLLASSGSLEEISRVVTQYYYTTADRVLLVPQDTDVWLVRVSGKSVPMVAVRLRKGERVGVW